MSQLLQYRENRIRGTEDFPVSLYRFVRKERLVTLHWHPEIEILYVANGEMTVNVSEEQYLLKAGDIFFINPEELHSMMAPKSGVDYYVAVFFPSIFQFQGKHFLEQDFTMPLINGTLRFPRLMQPGQPEYNSIHPLIHRMFLEDHQSRAMIFADLTALFCELLEHSMMVKVSDKNTYRHAEAIKTCIQYMEDHHEQKVTLAELADLVHMSQNYFCSYFKKYTGVSPFTQLNYIRIKEAEKILQKSDASIVSVSEACGFENVSFFIRKFKEITGFTPSVYRRRLK